MPQYRLTGPDGSVYNVTAPDGVAPDEVMRRFQSSIGPNHDAIAARIANDPISVGARKGGIAEGGIGADLQNFVAGYGSAVPRTLRGIGQRFGLVSQEDADQANKLDAPLLATKAGAGGNMLGTVAEALPTVALPAAATVGGAALIGAGLGASQPTSTGESAVKNALIGGGLGAGSVVTGQLLGAGYRGLKAIAEPFTAEGPTRIAGRTLQRFANDPASIANVTNAPTATGALPTLAEQTGDVGIARLQDALRSADPQLSNALSSRASQNNAARVNALRSLAGEDGARDFAVANRSGTAQQLYGNAFKADSAVTPSQLQAQAALPSQVGALLKTPAIADAREAAKTIAANRGTPIDDPAGSVEGLHYMKLAMDDAIAAAKNKGTAAGDNLAASIKSAQGRLVDAIETMSPDYKAARTTYAQMSQPINSMDVAATLAKKGLSNGTDLATGAPTINRNALLGAMKDEPALVRQATGRSLGGLSDVMQPNDLNLLRTIASEADRAGAVAAAGNGPGSATAQRLASQNILRQVITPGQQSATPNLFQRAGQAVVDNTLANTVVGKATNWLYSGIAEPKIQQALLKSVLSPEEAKAAITAAQQQGIQLPNNVLTRLLGQARRVAGPSATQSRQP